MYLVLYTILIIFLKLHDAYIFDEVTRKCLDAHNETLSNDFLIGKWYKLFEFTGSVLAPSKSCPTMEFTRPTRKHLDVYRQKYNITEKPFSFDESSLVLKENRMTGLVMGNNETKFYVLDPKEVMVIHEVFKTFVFKRLNENYVIYFHCEMRGNVVWLLSRYRNVTDVETDGIINNTPIFRNKKVQRYCVDTIKPYPIMQGGRFCSCHCCSV